MGVAHKVGPYPDHKFLGVADEFLAILFEPSFTDANDDLEGTTTNLYWWLHPKGFRTKIFQNGHSATLKINVCQISEADYGLLQRHGSLLPPI